MSDIFSVREIHPAVGAEVTGVDLSRPISADIFGQIREAFLKYSVLLLRGQTLNEQQLIDFTRQFNELESYAATIGEFLQPGYPDIICLSNIVKDGKPLGVARGGQYWHTDRSYVPKPAWGSVLHSLIVPHDEAGEPLGDTLFASMTAAAAALDPEERDRLKKLSAWHEYVYRFTQRDNKLAGTAHPIILNHPVTNAECLYVNPGFTHRILDLPENEGEALLKHLYAHATRSQFVYRHRWRVGDVIMWDNYATQHNAIPNYRPDQPRLMWRTTIQGFPLKHVEAACGVPERVSG